MSFQEAQEPLAKRTKICGHCNRELSLVAYKTHLHRFYDYTTNTWRKDDNSPLQPVKPFTPTLLREKAFQDVNTAIPLSENLQTMDYQTEVQAETCGGDAGIEDDTPNFQNITPDVFTELDVSYLIHTGSYSAS